MSVKISVILITYNHGKYVRRAIESILNQNMDYDMELLVGDDCSPDNTQEILKEYIERFPNVIRPFLREKNVGAHENASYLMKQCKGEYVAILEGDDYWTDMDKLQKQIKFLDEHKQYIACCHKFSVIDEYENVYYDRDFEIQFVKGNEYTVKDFENGKMSSHSNTIVFRRDFITDEKFWRVWSGYTYMASDSTFNLLLALTGEIFCMNEVMSHYRKVTAKTSTSFSAMQEKENKRAELFLNQLQMQQIVKNVYNKRISFTKRKKNIFASAVFKWMREKSVSNFKVIFRIIGLSRRPIEYFFAFLYLIIAKKIMFVIYGEDRRVNF